MKDDQILEIAKSCEFDLVRFFREAQRLERIECANLCAEIFGESTFVENGNIDALKCQRAIRSRGEEGK